MTEPLDPRIVARETVQATFEAMGYDDPKQLILDLEYLSKLRAASNKFTTIAFGTAITILITGILGALWVGFASAIQAVTPHVGG